MDDHYLVKCLVMLGLAAAPKVNISCGHVGKPTEG